MLKEYRKQREIQIKWTTITHLPPRQFTLSSHPRSAQQGTEAGVLYDAPHDGRFVYELRWTALPSKEDQAIEWNIVRPSDPQTVIVAHALSIEENDLLAFATW